MRFGDIFTEGNAMIHCPKCKEALGDNITVCPFCRHEITDYERVLIAKEQREEEEDIRYEEMVRAEAFAMLRRIWGLGSVVYLVILYLVFSILLYSDHAVASFRVFFGGLFFFLFMTAYLIFVKKANSCPHCGKYLFRNWGTNCQWCGGRIR